MLQETRHDVDLLLGKLARGTPVGHAAGAAVVDQHLEKLGAAFLGDFRGERLAGRTLAQDTVAARAALKIQFGRQVEFRLGHIRCAGCNHALHFTLWHGCAFVGHLARGHARVVGFILGQGGRRRQG